MTENSVLWTTNDTGDGAASGYTATEWFEVWRSLFAGSTGADLGGVAPGYLNELAVSGMASPVSVATGAALVYGIPYFNDGAVSVAIPTPVSQNRYDRVVLRAVWAAQTVRITRVAGTEGAGTPPALTQSAGSTWDIALATVLITPAGAVTVTDSREYLQLVAPLGIETGDIADSAVTTAKIADGNVTNAKLASMAQTTIKGRAAGAGTGAPTDLTATQLVDVLETGDGSGSGLDADTLDGQHASEFATAGHNHDSTYAATAHNHDSTYAATAHNHDSTYAATAHNHDSTYAATAHNHDSTYAATAHTHDAAGINSNAVTNAKLADMAQATVKGRAVGAGTGAPTDLTATQLRNIVKEADGSSSGLDADTLDTLHAADFATAGHTHDYAATTHTHDYAASDHTHAAVPVTVSGLTVYRVANVVQVSFGYTKSDSSDATIGTYSALPTPTATVYATAVAGSAVARVALSTGKVITISGAAGAYYIHLVYLTAS